MGNVIGQRIAGVETGITTRLAASRFDGSAQRHFLDIDKIGVIAQCRQTRDATPALVFHIGDSRSDLPLFGKVGFAVTQNSSAQARAAAHVALDSDKLYEIPTQVPGLLDLPAQPQS
ncbi:hypothetical protein [Chitiniphilus eburneus]|uniref:hypothetical protein n=1 Tax=Chitiniphilus eburneus TaxID=2571148 RepID=UPI001B7FDBC5|nr:hypothetical protein [Chitiniphilus eburneus]